MNKGHRICFSDGKQTYKICRVFYGQDGSFYATVPYHPQKKAVLFLATVNYSKHEQRIATKELVELADLEDEALNLKYSHHPDGFIQFSGNGIVSGKNADGSPKGMGIHSWPLNQPIAGPAFAVTITGVEKFTPLTETEPADILFSNSEIAINASHYTLFLEAHYFPKLWSRFIRRTKTGERELLVSHPAGGVISMRPLFPPHECPNQNFLAIEMYAEAAEAQNDSCQIIFSGSTGNIRQNEEKEKLGDGLYYMFPDHEIPAKRNLNYHRR
ncbi:MAG TPA: hypothetical protein VHY30_05415 [Verrucomicrobiae bacterium]|jgi:hypothetical protein|nr:hypothetical protein [Verrucomicrobiae bacterium]